MCARQAQTLHQLTYIPVPTAPLLESMHGFLKVDPLEVVLCNNGGLLHRILEERETNSLLQAIYLWKNSLSQKRCHLDLSF